MKTHHVLKCDAEPFDEIWIRNKRAEFRKNDRNFKVGDTITLCENCQIEQRAIDATITHIQHGYGIPEGFVMLSFRITRWLAWDIGEPK